MNIAVAGSADNGKVGSVFSDLAIDPVNTGFVYAYAAWDDGPPPPKNVFGTILGGGTYSVQGVLTALSMADGSTQWTLPLPPSNLPSGWTQLCSDYGNAAPAIDDDGTVYVGNGDGLRAVDGPTGTVKWLFPSANVSSSPAIGGDGTIFFGCSDGSFYALKKDGSLRFEIPAGHPVSSSPAIADDGTVFFVSDDGKLWAIK